jgi:hypothetical protein
VRRMKGAIDLTVEVDRIDDAVLEETGTYVASFILEGEILGEIEFPVYVQAAAQKLSKETEEGLRKSDVIWVGTRANGHKRMAPVVRLQGREDLPAVVPRSGSARANGAGRAGRAGARGGDAAEAPRHGAPGVHRRAAVARRTRVGERREHARGSPPEQGRSSRGLDLPLAGGV